MTIYVYDTPTTPEHLTKDISTLVSPAAGWGSSLRDAVSIDAPVILVEATVTTGNYCQIPDFGRYYWITDRNIIRDDLTELTLRSDPLMSFAEEISKLPVYATRTQKRAASAGQPGWNSYLSDKEIPKTAREFTIVIKDPNIPKFEYPDSAIPDSRQYVFGVIG